MENDPHPTPSSERNTFGIFSPKDNCTIPTHKLSTKTLYEIIQKLQESPSPRYRKWDSIIGPLRWNKVWAQCYDNFSENRLCDNHWRVLHRSLPLAPSLYKCNGDVSPFCSLCSENQYETLVHILFECKSIQPLLRQTQEFITKIKGSPFNLELKHMIINISIIKKDFVTLLCNYLINVTRYTIWTVRNIQKHESRSVNLQNFARLIIKERLNVEHFIYRYLKKDLVTFARTWAHNNVLCSLEGSNLVQLL